MAVMVKLIWFLTVVAPIPNASKIPGVRLATSKYDPTMLIPITTSLVTVPSARNCSTGRAVSVVVTSAPLRQMLSVMGVEPLATIRSFIAVKLFTGVPFTASTTSPGSSPASFAGLSGCTKATIAGTSGGISSSRARPSRSTVTLIMPVSSWSLTTSNTSAKLETGVPSTDVNTSSTCRPVS